MKKGGYILFEIMLAVFIFAMCFVALGKALSSLVETAHHIQKETYVLEELENRLALARKGYLQPGKDREDADARGVEYVTEITPLQIKGDDNALLPGMYSIQVTATWGNKSAADTKSVEVTVYQP